MTKKELAVTEKRGDQLALSDRSSFLFEHDVVSGVDKDRTVGRREFTLLDRLTPALLHMSLVYDLGNSWKDSFLS